MGFNALITILVSHILFIKTTVTKQQAASLLGSNLSEVLFGRQNKVIYAERKRERGVGCKVKTTGDLLVFNAP